MQERNNADWTYTHEYMVYELVRWAKASCVFPVRDSVPVHSPVLPPLRSDEKRSCSAMHKPDNITMSLRLFCSDRRAFSTDDISTSFDPLLELALLLTG